jgi:DNA-binding winged helix-turn-helix (wHTH) protein/pimeloyl-ACP methyl ester carboxylesterase
VIYTFEECSLDIELRELQRSGEVIAVEPRVFDLLLFLVRKRTRVVSKDDLIAEVWNGRIVSESTLSSTIALARQAIGDTGEAQRFIRTVTRKGYRFVGDVREVHPLHRASGSPRPPGPRQEIRYCRAPDGVRLAYATAGSGPPLVRSGTFLTHLEYDWESPIWGHLMRGLTASYALIRHDARGNGLSDWDVGELSIDAWVSDLESVIDAVGLQRFPLLGSSQGSAISIAYAVRHPERVSHLVLYGGYALGGKKRAPTEKQQRKAMATLMRLGWGTDNPAFRQMFTGYFVPGATREQMDWFSELQRRATSPECAARYWEAVGDIDVTDLLGRVTTPTLVIHTRGDLVVPLEAGRQLAAGIPGARFVVLEGQNHLFLEHETAAQRFLEELKLFLSLSWRQPAR